MSPGQIARLLILPPHCAWEPWTGRRPQETEDRELPFRLLAERGYSYRRIDVGRPPWNLWSNAHPLLRAIDPLRALRVLLCERRAAIAICSYEPSAFILILLRAVLRSKLKVVVFDVGVPGEWRLRDVILDLVVPHADAVLPVGSNQAAAILARWKLRGFLQVVPICTDCDFYVMAEDRPDGPILSIGDDLSRDYDTLMTATIGFPGSIAVRTRLIRPSAVTQPNVTILSAPLEQIAYRDLIATALIVVLPLHPSNHAGGVSVLLQAMASGKAVVVSQTEGLADYIRPGETCLVVPPHDPLALRAAMLKLVSDPALRIALGKAARAHLVARLSLPAEADMLEAVIRRLI